MRLKATFLCFIFTLLCENLFAEEKLVELSFGTSQMLVDEVDRAELKDRKKIILPTTGALLIAEYLWNDDWGTLLSVNIPLVTQKFIVNNELIEESAAKTILIGQRYTPIHWKLSKNATLSPQVSMLISTILGSNPQISPTAAARLHIAEKRGFSMYLGSSATYGIKGYVLFYGIGHRF